MLYLFSYLKKSFLIISGFVLLILFLTSFNYSSIDVLSRAGGGGSGGGGGSSRGSSSSSIKNRVTQQTYAFQNCYRYGTEGNQYKDCTKYWWTDSLDVVTSSLFGFGLLYYLLIKIFKSRIKWFYMFLEGSYKTSFVNQSFTSDPKILSEIQSYYPNFQNQYNLRQLKDKQIWKKVELASEIHPETNDKKITNLGFMRSEIILEAMQIFFRYQDDWSKRDIQKSAEYMTVRCFSENKKYYQEMFKDFQDIVIEPQILEIKILEIQNKDLCRMQINAQMINLTVDKTNGKVVRGTPEFKQFTEYWTFKLGNNKQIILDEISW